MTALLWAGIAALGGTGAIMRFVVDRAVAARTGRSRTGSHRPLSARMRQGFPYGTLVVNLTGAALLGLLSGLAVNRTIALLAGTAVLGSYTTFSTWMFESHRLGEERQTATASLNVLTGIVLGLLAAALGRFVGRQL